MKDPVLETAADINRGRVHCKDILLVETGVLLQEADLSKDRTLQVPSLICCCMSICFGVQECDEETVVVGEGCGE